MLRLPSDHFVERHKGCRFLQASLKVGLFAKKIIDNGDCSNARIAEPEMIGDTKIRVLERLHSANDSSRR